MRGRGQYVGDIKLPGMLEVAFLRSPLAHARIKVDPHPARASRPHLYRRGPGGRAADPRRHDAAGLQVLDPAGPRHGQGAPRRRARGHVHRAHAGGGRGPRRRDRARPRAAARRRRHARWRASPAHRWCTSPGATTSSSSPTWRRTSRPSRPRPPYSVTRELRTSRQVMSPLEGRGVVAQWHSRLGQLVVHTSTQQPHIVRSGLAECLGVDEGQIRVMAPDVGGGFGYKGILLPRGGGAVVGDAQARRRRCGGSRTGARTSPPTPTAASITTCSPPTPTRTAGCWRSTARRPSIPAPTRPIRSRRAWRRGRWARSCRASTTSRTTAAAPTRSPPTSRRSCPTAAWLAPACASRWR